MRTKKILASVLAFATVAASGSCGGGGGRTAPTDNPDTTTTTTATTTEAMTYDTDVALQEAVQNVEVKGDLNPTKKIKWLAWWPIDETSAPAELFKANYGIPEEGDQSYGDEADKIFVYTNVSYNDRYDRLGQLVSAGDSPDIFPFEIGYFPLAAYKGMFQPIDGVVDTYAEEWADIRADMDKFVWGGKNYCAITEITTNGLYWYRRSVVEEAGFEDPYDLYMKGEWTWDKFLEMADKFQQSGDNKYVIDGWGVSEELLATSGVPLIAIEDGRLVSHLYDPAVEKAMALAEMLCTQNYRYDRATLNSWSVNYKAWLNGDTLFFDEGTWFWQDNMWKYEDRGLLETGDTFFVPAPRNPDSDTYYQAMKQDAYMWVAGSTNSDGFAAWTNCVLAASKDENVAATAREKNKRDRLWTDEMLDFLEVIKKDMTAVWDFKNGISTAAATTSSMEASPIESLIKIPYVTGTQSFTQLRAEKQGEIDSAINEVNSTVE